MPRYTVNVSAKVTTMVVLEADSPEEAEAQALRMFNEGIHGPTIDEKLDAVYRAKEMREIYGFYH